MLNQPGMDSFQVCPGLHEKLTSSLFLRHMKLEVKYSYFKSTPNLKSVTYWNNNDKHASLQAQISDYFFPYSKFNTAMDWQIMAD